MQYYRSISGELTPLTSKQVGILMLRTDVDSYERNDGATIWRKKPALTRPDNSYHYGGRSSPKNPSYRGG